MSEIPDELWVSCDVEPDEEGWYCVQRYDEYGEPYKVACKRLYWNNESWFYDEDCCVAARMSVETNDCWKEIPLLLM